MKSFVMISALMLVVALVYAQCNLDWATIAGGILSDRGYDVSVDQNNNIYLTGSFAGLAAEFGGASLISEGGDDIFVAKANSSGNWLWARRAGGSLADRGRAITTNADGVSYVTGHFRGDANFSDEWISSQGYEDVFVAKIDANGNWEWAVRAGGDSYDYGYGIATDASGNCYVTGSFVGTASFGSTNLFSNGSTDVFIAKLSPDGNWLWAVQAGGNGSESGEDVTIDNYGNVYLTGYFRNTASFGAFSQTSAGGEDIFVARLNSSGNWLWAQRAGGESNAAAYGICHDDAGYCYITGDYWGDVAFGSYPLTGGNEVFIAKIDSGGNWIWAIRTISDETNQAWDIDISCNGHLFIAGQHYSEITFGTHTLLSAGSYDAFTAMANTEGNWLWAADGGGIATDYCGGVATDAAGSAIAVGDFYDEAVFSPLNLISGGSHDVFIVKYNLTPVPAAPQNLQISVLGNDVFLQWDPVDQDIYGNSLIPSYYLIFRSDNPVGEYVPVMQSQQTSVVDIGAGSLPVGFYRVSAETNQF